MTLQQVTYFCAICEEMHYTKAAARLHVSQPCLSYAISELEKELDVPLFLKKSKQLFLTEYGELFLPYAKKVLALLSEGVSVLENKKSSKAERINIGYLFSLSLDFLPAAIDLYYRHIGHHGVPINFIQCHMPDVAEKILTSEIDVAFASPYHEHLEEPVVAFPVYEQELYLMVPKGHRLFGLGSVVFDEIKDENYIAINPDMGLRRQMDEYFRQRHVSPKIIFGVNDSQSLVSYVESGLGVAFLARIPSLNYDKVSLLRISDQPMKRDVCLMYSTEREYNSVVSDFINFIRTSAPLPISPALNIENA